MRISAIDARHAGVRSTIRLEPSLPTAVYLKEWLFLAYLLGCLHLSILKASREVERSYGIAYRSARKVMHAIHKGEDEGGSGSSQEP
jgi:hypothetical protein